MTNAETATLQEIHLAGLAALRRELGAVGLVRFLQQFELGQGDYTAERHHVLGDQSVREVMAEVVRNRPQR